LSCIIFPPELKGGEVQLFLYRDWREKKGGGRLQGEDFRSFVLGEKSGSLLTLNSWREGGEGSSMGKGGKKTHQSQDYVFGTGGKEKKKGGGLGGWSSSYEE